jgi:hypothetical protein
MWIGGVRPMPHNLTAAARLADALRRIYDRAQPPVPWRDGANLPWDDPAFSERMLAQHLDQSHGAASRPQREIRAQVQRMAEWLGLAAGGRLLDVTCGSARDSRNLTSLRHWRILAIRQWRSNGLPVGRHIAWPSSSRHQCLPGA